MQSVECTTVKITIVTMTPLRGMINQNIHCTCDVSNRNVFRRYRNGSIICQKMCVAIIMVFCLMNDEDVVHAFEEPFITE